MGYSLPYSNNAITTVVQVSPNPVRITAMKLVNTTGSTAYLQVFAKASADVSLGTTVADFFIRLEANESIYLVYDSPVLPSGSVGLSLAGTTTPTGSTGAAISATVFYD